MNARRSLVEAELVSSVGWMIELRWIAGAGVLLATWVVENLFRLDAAEWPLYAIGITILAYNLVFYLQKRQLNRRAAPISAYYRLAKWQVALDWLAITLLIYFSGGIESPVIFFFFFHIIIASILFPPRTAFGFTLLAIVLLTGTALLEYFGILPHSPIGGFLQSPLYQNGLYVSAMLLFFSSTALITAYLVTSIQERLRAREEDVVNLSVRVERKVKAVDDRLHVAAGACAVDAPQPIHRLGAEDDIFPDGVLVDEHQLLMHHADAGSDRFAGATEAHALPAIDDVAAVVVDQAVEHLHQRAFACAVLADEGMNLAVVEAHRHVVQRHDGGWIDLDDAAHLDEIRGEGQGASCHRRSFLGETLPGSSQLPGRGQAGWPAIARRRCRRTVRSGACRR